MCTCVLFCVLLCFILLYEDVLACIAKISPQQLLTREKLFSVSNVLNEIFGVRSCWEEISAIHVNQYTCGDDMVCADFLKTAILVAHHETKFLSGDLPAKL